MGTTQPPSPTTVLSAIRAAASKLGGLGLAQGLLRIAPGLPAAALAGVAILFFAWSCEHRARQREAAEAQQAKKQAAEQISQLEKQAASAVRDAQQSSQAAKELEGQRQQLAREADGLRQSLDSLRNQELVHANELASLTTEEVVNRVAARLQEQGIGNREQGTAAAALNPLTRPATADESAPAGHPLPQGGEGNSRGARMPGARGQGKTHLPIRPPHHLPRWCCRTRACGRWKAPSWSSIPAASRAR